MNEPAPYQPGHTTPKLTKKNIKNNYKVSHAIEKKLLIGLGVGVEFEDKG